MFCIFIKYASAKCNAVSIFHYLNINAFRYLSTNKNEFKKEESPRVSLQGSYHPKDVESHRYEWWESRNYFKAKSELDSFTVLLPPPNVTGILHLGHALTLTIQDALLRWKRMKGESVLWIPGIDHAGIATQSIVEKHLHCTSGLTKFDLGKEEFLKRVEEWKKEKGNTIIEQLKNMGASLDWSRLIYTMDPNHSHLVTNSFIQLYNDGLICREKSLVNWSCALKSSVSDIEVDHMEINKRTKLNIPGYEKPVTFGTTYEFAYKICDEDDEIVVSTTRPETMLGDVAVAVHPDSAVHSKFINKLVWHPFRLEKIPVIADRDIRPDFGTGAVKITPAHSLTDYEISLRHNLKAIAAISEEGIINKVGANERIHGLKRFDARNVIIDELKRLKLFRGQRTHPMKVPLCSRSGDVIEYMPRSQWFLKCHSLAQKAVEAVENGDLKLEPSSYKNVWIDWLKTKLMGKWNLSRQLWWGHQIPMYKCQFEGQKVWVAARSIEEAKSKAAKELGAPVDGVEVTRDPDVVDTWFSSGLLPLNPNICQGKKPPISLLVTGHDILFFWIARMVMLSIHLTGGLPFNQVLLHGLVCDANGKKMSKSLGNVVSPEEITKGISVGDMAQKLSSELAEGHISQKDFQAALNFRRKTFPNGIPECGVDGLRFTLCSTFFRSAFVNFDINLCRSSRFFCNKIYQSMNYFIKITDKYRDVSDEFDLADLKSETEKLNCFDRWILSRLTEAVQCMNDGFTSCTFSVGAAAIRSFFVEDFCSHYLESSKIILEKCSPSQCRTTVSVFFHCMETSLRLLSPFMPFLTEHLYHRLPLLKGFHRSESITVAQFPDPADWVEFRDARLNAQFMKIWALLTVVRKAKGLLHPKEEKPNVFVECPDEMAKVLFGGSGHVFSKLSGAGDMYRVENLERSNVLGMKVEETCTAFIEHHHDRETLVKLLGPEINKEDDLNENLQKLLSELNATESEKLTPREQIMMKKIDSLKSELDRIEEFKRAINSCSA